MGAKKATKSSKKDTQRQEIIEKRVKAEKVNLDHPQGREQFERVLKRVGDPKNQPNNSLKEAAKFGHPTGGAAIPDDSKATSLVISQVLAQTWGITEPLDPLSTGSTARVWSAGDKIVKLARDDSAHFNVGLRASLAIQANGIEAGAPNRTTSGEISKTITVNNKQWMMAVFQRVGGTSISMHAFPPAVLGELLARIHISLLPIGSSGAWTVADVLGHMRRGVLKEQPLSTQQLILASVEAVQVWYDTVHPPMQLIRGDGPEILSQDQENITAIIDWGGVRFGSVVDDIGCWTVHGATDVVPIKEYTELFMQGYMTIGAVTPEEREAIPLFQRLRVASRLCYVTDRDALAVTEEWMGNISR